MAVVLMAAYTNYRRDPRVKREAEALVEVGNRVVFLARRQPGEPDREVISGVDVVKVPGLHRKPRSFAEYMLDYCLFFVSLFLHVSTRPLRYDLIHVNNMPDFLVFAAVVPRLAGRPVIHDVHDLMPELYAEKFGSGEGHWLLGALRLQERWAGRFASVVLTVEERLKEILANRGIPPDKIHVLMNLPDERIFSLRPPQPPKGADAPFVIVYHGTLARRLGLDVAMQAAARARQSIERVELRIIGAGEERARLLALRDSLGLHDVVTFSEGFVPVEEIPGRISDADVGLVPLRISDGTDIMLPTKLLEYVSLGIPCIAPRTGTIARYFDDRMLAFFEAENVDDLARVIIELHQDPARRAALAREATERFGRTHTWRIHKVVYTTLVRTLLRGRRSGRWPASSSGREERPIPK
jgi:glycosyltransferase involved in cell wall biosynthesis